MKKCIMCILLDVRTLHLMYMYNCRFVKEIYTVPLTQNLFKILTGPPSSPPDHGFGDYSRCPQGITSPTTCKQN